MSGCLVELVFRLIAVVVAVIFRIFGFLMMLMVTAIASLFVGVDIATDRIAQSWIEQYSSQGINIGYNPVSRDGMKAAAGLMLVVGWLLTIGAVWWIVVSFAN